MNVIWYNTIAKAYQFGSYEEFQQKLSGNPHDILALERFRDASERTLMKIVTELNKCQITRPPHPYSRDIDYSWLTP